MDPAAWKQLKGLLEDALELEANDRKRFIADRVPDEQRREFEELLRFETESARLMDISAGEFAGEMIDGPSPLEGKQIGVYTIVSELGSGGMGTVYLAERSDGKFDRRVAVKLLRRELNSERIRQRFEQEKTILSKLLHPNIAALIDAGTTDDGVPYLVMEHVDGKPIDAFCSTSDLGLRDRLKLFNKVCDAVVFAHRNLIVHRDLKPSNILVTSDGQPKLLDFGIAKLLDDTNSDSLVTNLGAMTPQYASPEQINGEAVTTATDVYSLGVVLFKILTGTYPYVTGNGTTGEMLREITDSEPSLPSEAVKRDTANGAERQSRPIADSILKGDLDVIVSKAIRKEPELRYAGVDEFSDDIWRFLDRRPIMAMPATFSYRAAKFLRRHRVSVTAGALILASLIAGLGVAGWQARAARAEADRAAAEQARSDKVAKFMLKIVSYANPSWWAAGSKYAGQARVIDVIKDLDAQIDTEFAGQPDIQAELHYKLAEAYLAYSDPELKEAGRAHSLRALELRRQYYGDYHELVAKDMAYVYWSGPALKSDADIAQFAYAITMLRNTNPKNRNLPFMLEDLGARMFDDSNPTQAEAVYSQVPERASMDRYQVADRYFLEMLDLLRYHWTEQEAPIAFCKCALAGTRAKVGALDDARSYYEQCLTGLSALPAGANKKGWINRLRKAEELLGLPPAS